jgi:hypothetical protein
MKRVLLFACCLAWNALAESPEEFRYSIPLTTQSNEGLNRVELPLAVHQGAARADLGDLRVFDARGEKVPFAFAGQPRIEAVKRPATALPIFPLRQMQRTQAAALDLQIRQRPDGTLISLQSGGKKAPTKTELQGYLVDASRLKIPMRALVLDWMPGADSQIGRLNVETSDDLKFWQPLVSGAPLLDLEFGGERLAQKRVEFSATRAKYLRLTWGGPAFDLKDLQVEFVDAEVERPFRSVKVAGTKGEKPGEYLFDLGARVPVERLRLELPQANTVAPVQLLSRPDPKSEWRMVAAPTFYRLTREGIEMTAPPLEIGARNERYWLMRVDQRGGGLGTGTPLLEAGWAPRQIVFVARGEGPYSLGYGKAGAEVVAFPVSHLIPGYQPDAEFRLPVVSTGLPLAAGGEDEASFAATLRSTDWKRVTLWSILVIGVAVLGWMAWRLGGQLNAPPETNKSNGATKPDAP